ncbi:hypothetical protein ACOMCU_24640 [Lysinibacillus sp. UGB7]|uniref:hypothetical protein n=1 Tax=Lysinibacillus sp. UGB7 TaxID=3411039 RepID=UPI003B79FE00
MEFTIDLIEKHLLETFKDKDMSYLALTSRSENTFRDLFAEHMQNTFAENQILVSRESKIKYDTPIKQLSFYDKFKNSSIKPQRFYSKTFVDLLISEYTFELEKRVFIEFGWHYSTEYLWRSQQIRNKIINDFGKNIPALVIENEKIRKKARKCELKFFQIMFIVDFEIDSRLTPGEANKKYSGVIRHLFDYGPDSNGLYKEMTSFKKKQMNSSLLKIMQDKAFGEDMNSPKLKYPYSNKRVGKLGIIHNFQEFNVQIYYIIFQKEWCTCETPSDYIKWNSICSNCNKESLESLYIDLKSQ